MIVEVPRCGEFDTNFRFKIVNKQTNEGCVTGYTDFADAQDGNAIYSLKDDRIGNCTSTEFLAGEGPNGITEKLRVTMEASKLDILHHFHICNKMVSEGYFRFYKTDDRTIEYKSSKRSFEQASYLAASMEFDVFLIALERTY